MRPKKRKLASAKNIAIGADCVAIGMKPLEKVIKLLQHELHDRYVNWTISRRPNN